MPYTNVLLVLPGALDTWVCLQVRCQRVRAAQPAESPSGESRRHCLSQIARLAALQTGAFPRVNGPAPAHALYGPQPRSFALEDTWMAPEFVAALQSPLASDSAAALLAPLAPVACAFEARDSTGALVSGLVARATRKQAVLRHTTPWRSHGEPCAGAIVSPLVDLFEDQLSHEETLHSLEPTQASTALEPLVQLLEGLREQHPGSHALRRMLVATLEADGTPERLRRGIDALTCKGEHASGVAHCDVAGLEDAGADDLDHAHTAGVPASAQAACAADLRAACLLVQRVAARDAQLGADLRGYLGECLGAAGRAAVLLEARNPQDLLGAPPDATEAVQWVAQGLHGAGTSMAASAPAVACALRKLEDDTDLQRISRCVCLAAMCVSTCSARRCAVSS